MLTVLLLVAPVARAANDDGWVQPRTADGQPDIQGVWTNETLTPFERSPKMADRPFLSADEARAIAERTARNRATTDAAPPPGVVGAYNEFWMDSGDTVLKTLQTSIVVDPPDGRVRIRPAAERARDATRARESESYEYLGLYDRCITRGVPGSMFPAGYNNAYQILQTEGFVVIVYEMIHDARIIPLDGRPHAPRTIGLWMGDSRGRWEGDTLVVETTNYNDRGWIATHRLSGRLKGIRHTTNLRVVERFTRVDEDTLSWQATIEDAQVYESPWTVSMPLSRDADYQIYEYACHEGNRAVPNILRGARAEEHD